MGETLILNVGTGDLLSGSAMAGFYNFNKLKSNSTILTFKHSPIYNIFMDGEPKGEGQTPQGAASQKPEGLTVGEQLKAQAKELRASYVKALEAMRERKFATVDKSGVYFRATRGETEFDIRYSQDENGQLKVDGSTPEAPGNTIQETLEIQPAPLGSEAYVTFERARIDPYLAAKDRFKTLDRGEDDQLAMAEAQKILSRLTANDTSQ